MAYKRILVAVDNSQTSNKGMLEAIKLAKESRGKLLLLHVIEEFAAFSAPELSLDPGPILDAMRDAGRRTLTRIERRARAAGARPETKVVENYSGRVANAIDDQAKRWRADLIVIGTHGRRGFNRLLLGSDAELVVRYSPVPVLLVPARGRAAGRR
jgi:nucleotide-binding universal stress UspA family protein